MACVVKRSTSGAATRGLDRRNVFALRLAASDHVEKLRRQLAVAQRQIADLKARLGDQDRDEEDDDLPPP